MARVLAYTSPARGHLYPLTSILAGLRETRGHPGGLANDGLSGAADARARLRRGADRPAHRGDRARDWQTSSAARGARGRSVATFLARARYDGPDMRTTIADTDPDIAIVDINSWGAMAAAEAWGGRWASVCPYPLPVSSRDAPPFGPGLPPARGPLGRLRDRLVRPVVLGDGRADEMIPKVNAVRTEHGLGPVKSADELYGRPPLLLYLTAEPFEYPAVRLAGERRHGRAMRLGS